MAIKRMRSDLFVAELKAALNRKDGYIMGSKGQNPKKWDKDSWWFTQYSGSQKKKALYWRENAERVWDCNGMSEGIYEDFSGVNINTKARYNYANWCDPKGKGMIPVEYRIPGAAVFWSDSGASSIHHVGYLIEPVAKGKPEGDWYLIEARGVMYGVVRTKLLSRKPNYWGLMTKYFDYSNSTKVDLTTDMIHLGDRTLKNGSEGEDVKEMQEALIRLGYDLGKWGADGDFGDCTEQAVRAFQKAKKLTVDGVVGTKTVAALTEALQSTNAGVQDPQKVIIVGGNCYVRDNPSVDTGLKLGVAHEGESYNYLGQQSENAWLKIEWQNGFGWVSGKYGKLVK